MCVCERGGGKKVDPQMESKKTKVTCVPGKSDPTVFLCSSVIFHRAIHWDKNLLHPSP